MPRGGETFGVKDKIIVFYQKKKLPNSTSKSEMFFNRKKAYYIF